MRETYEQLQIVCTVTTGSWNGARRFQEFPRCLLVGAPNAFNVLIVQDYPNPADTTDVGYKELFRGIVTKLLDHGNLGDRIHQYLTSNVQ